MWKIERIRMRVDEDIRAMVAFTTGERR